MTTCFVKINSLSFFFLFVLVNSGIPLWFRCFKGKHNPEAYSLDLIKQGISYCFNLFSDTNYHITFLADRWFTNTDILSFIQSIGAFFCIRAKSFFRFFYFDSNRSLVSKQLKDIHPHIHDSVVLNDVLFTRKLFKTNIVVSRSCVTGESWFLITNDVTSRAVRNYSYRFGSIESIFKSQKSNGFRLESTNTQKIEHFISLFTVMCIALLWLTIIGVDYNKNKHHYYLHIRDTRKHPNSAPFRLYSFFNLGLTIFNMCYYNHVDFVLKFSFVPYDV